MSIVKESKRKGRFLVPEYNVETSNLFQNPEKYEIELEIIPAQVGVGTAFDDIKSLDSIIKKMTKFILSGLQKTNYPVSYTEQDTIGQEYLKMILKDKYKEVKRIYPSHFIGPSSYTLQINNIAPINNDIDIPNIRNNYTVTEKADGLRKLLYISKKGKIYLFDTNMNIEFTGAVTKNKDFFETLLDGEHILHNKKNEFINLFAAFDVYYIGNEDIRRLHFLPITEEEKEKNDKYRLYRLIHLIKNLDPISIVGGKLTPIRIENKKFVTTFGGKSIFSGCNLIMEQINKNLFTYETDGLIFTPMNLGVGLNNDEEELKSWKSTWDYSFKWKPAEFNTVDFLITTQKTPTNEDFIGNIFQDGKDTLSVDQLSQYKRLILRVGFDEKKHGYINPCADIINNKLPNIHNVDDNEGYKPLPFYPTNPYDPEANICNILLRSDNFGNKKIYTEEDQVIEDNMIVEFRYDLDREKQWRWVPLKVRYDKTAEFRRGLKNYGNAYHVANSNWHSIHNPITRKMISTGKEIPNELGDDDIYYNRISKATQTRGLRDFHNLFVKKLLVMSVSKRGDTLIDYAVGKGGDIPKWIAAKLSFVFGIDISKDNIENRLDGVCARFLNYRKKIKKYAIWIIFTW